MELIELVIKTTDNCRSKLEEESFVIVTNTGKAINVSLKIHNTMMDLIKMKRNLCSKLGADCILCKHPQNDWMNQDIIEQGFRITTSAADTLEIYESLLGDDGNILKEKGDYSKRNGSTRKPITTSDLYSITITHSWINITNWFIKILARLNAEYKVWELKSTIYGDHIRAGTTRVQDIIYSESGRRLSQVSGPLQKSGGSTQGNDGRVFFTLQFLPIILKCIPQKYHQTIQKLHKNLSCMLRIISSSSSLNWYAFHNLARETSLLLATKLDWVKINWTLHGVLHHSCELIEVNDKCGLGMLSEEALESNNKYIRKFLEDFSRKMCSVKQLTDVMNRLLERSDPCINWCRLKYNRTIECNTCGSSKHSTRGHQKALTFDEYDTLVHDILIDIDSFY